MPTPRIKLSPIKRSLPEPIRPVLNSPAPAAPASVVSQTPWRGVPVPPKKGSTAPFDPPAPFVAPAAYQPPASGGTIEPFASAASVEGPALAESHTSVEPAPALDTPEAPVVTLADEATSALAPLATAPDSAEAKSGSLAAAALSLSRAQGTGTRVPAGTTAVAAASSASPAGENTVDGSGALLTASSQPAQIRAAGIFLKWAMFGLIGIAIAFALIRFVIPFLQELRHPSTPGAAAKDAPTAVRMLQQTREVVAKNDANAAYLNEIAATVEPKPVASPPAPAPVAAPVVAPVATPATAAADTASYQAAIDRMKVDSVVSGAAARAMIDGRLFRLGDIVDRRLGLRFTSVDVDAHTVLFTNADNVVFKKYY